MKKLLFILLCMISAQVAAQTSRLVLNADFPENNGGYTIYLLTQKDTIRVDSIPFLNSGPSDIDRMWSLDSLAAGEYRIYVYDNDLPEEFILKRYVKLEANLVTTVNLYLSESIYVRKKDEPIPQKTEAVFQLGYMDGNWLGQNSLLRQNYSAAVTFYGGETIGKHFKFMMGSGMGFSQHYFAKDTTLLTGIPYSKKLERYTNITLNYEVKLRISSANLKETTNPKFFMDLGAGYYFPVLLNHTALYESGKKVVNRHIHQFKDFRAFVNIGFSPVTVFFEYRLADFILGKYAEFPRYNMGLRFIIPAE